MKRTILGVVLMTAVMSATTGMPQARSADAVGAVYTATNSVTGNAIRVCLARNGAMPRRMLPC